MGSPHRALPLALLSLGALAACGGGKYGADSGYAYNSTFDTGANTSTSTTAPPETEGDFLAMPPAQTERYVFIANPNRGTLSRVTVDTLAVITTPVGADPRVVQTTPDASSVVVFNRADDSVSILDVETLEQTVVPVRDDLNQMKISPDSRWAVLWHDRSAVQPGDPPPQGLQSFNEASFVDLVTGEHQAMAVGYDPKDVVFTPDGRLAAVVSNSSLAVIPLDVAPLAPELISLSQELIPPDAEEVVLAPSGDWAFVRQFGATEVLVVDLLDPLTTPVPLGGNPTDLDLLPDGSGAVVVVRDTAEIRVLSTADPLGSQRVVRMPAGSGYGSIAIRPDGTQALLYTTASPVDRVGLWTPADDAIAEHGLVKPVSTVAIAPEGSGALIFHPTTDAPDSEPGDIFFGSHALTMLDLDSFRTNPLKLPAAPLGYALSDDGRRAIFAMQDQKYLELLDFQTLLHSQVALRSDPVYLGIMTDPDPGDAIAPLAWVSQDHDLGRISFYDADAGSLETITGFELNSGIE